MFEQPQTIETERLTTPLPQVEEQPQTEPKPSENFTQNEKQNFEETEPVKAPNIISRLFKKYTST